MPKDIPVSNGNLLFNFDSDYQVRDVYFPLIGQTGTLEIFPQYEEALEGTEAGQTLVTLFWLHQARRDVLKVYPRGDRSRGLHGVFSTRMRPGRPVVVPATSPLAPAPSRPCFTFPCSRIV